MKDIKHILILPLLLLFTMAVTNVYAQQEDAEALFAMGNRYVNGEGVEKNPEKPASGYYIRGGKKYLIP